MSTWPSPFKAHSSAAEAELVNLFAAATEELPPAGGLCAEVDPELWFPVSYAEDNRQVATAKRICAGCPVLSECARYGMTQAEGIWGGMTPGERRRLREQEARQRAELERVARTPAARHDSEVAQADVAEVA